MTTKSLKIESALHKRLKQKALDEDSTVQKEAEKAIRKYLKEVK